MRAIMVCVDYQDLLRVCLPYNRHHFDEVCVVTNVKQTIQTMELLDELGMGDIKLYNTDAFYHGNAVFNKWAALEEALDWYGRRGWMVLMDSDVLWPKNGSDILRRYLRPGFLYSPLRRMFTDTTQPLPPEDQWGRYPIHRNVGEWAGYSQVFAADDPVLGPPPWHEIDWAHAGGADSMFQQKWPRERKIRPPFEILHVGPAGANWCGRSTPYLDGTKPENADERAKMVKEIWEGRRGKHGPDRFRHEKLL